MIISVVFFSFFRMYQLLTKIMHQSLVINAKEEITLLTQTSLRYTDMTFSPLPIPSLCNSAQIVA